MSENPFADLLEAFKRGWEAGGGAAHVPGGTHVRARPSFWNPFLTWRDAEARELGERYEEVRSAFEASPFMDAGLLEETVTQILVTACEAAECDPPEETLAVMRDAVTRLVGEEFFLFVCFESPDWQNRLGLEDALQVKRALARKRRFLNDPERLFETGCRTITLIFASLLEFLPEGLRHEPADRTEASSSVTFGADLVELMERPAAAIEGTVATLFDKEVREGDLFAEVRARLEHNLYAASGLDPASKAASEKQLTLPTEAKDKTPPELADLYLRETPFADFFAASLPFRVPQGARFEHCHILGGTGHGKTQCLQYLLHADLARAAREPISLVVIDSQGDLIRKLSSSALFDPHTEGSLAERFILIDPSEIDRPPALNLFDPGLERLDGYSPRERERAFNSLVDIYGRFFGALLGAELTGRQEAVFRYLARLMLTVEGATIHTLIALMDDTAPFMEHIARLDPTARRFFEREFPRRAFNATRQQIKQRLYAVLSIPTFDRLFSAPQSKVRFFDALNSGGIILVNTAKDLLRSDGTAIFGRFILALIEHAVTERATLPEDARRPVFLYMDEAQDYFDDTVETLLVEARKYRCGLTLAHQNLAQLSPRLRAVFMGNTTVKLAGGVSDADARALAPDMRTSPDFLLSMRKREQAHESEFALSVRNLTPQALKVRIPLGHLEAHARLPAGHLETLLQANRERIGYAPQTEDRSTPAAQTEPEPGEGEQAQEIEEPRREPAPPEQATATAEPPPEADQRSAGAKDHRALQDRIRRAAQELGFAASVEQPVLDGAGSVDVALERGDLRIAVEVSATTRPEQERGNIEKCLKAGFSEVWVTSPEPSHLDALQTELAPGLSKSDRHRVRFLTPEQVIAELDRRAASIPASHTTVLGYEVLVSHEPTASAETAERRARLRAALAGLQHTPETQR